MVEQTDTIRQGVCFAPLQAFIPHDLRCYLPQWFLHAALVDSYESERCLLDMFPGKYEHTFVKPSAGRPLPIEYRSRAVVRKIQQTVPQTTASTSQQDSQFTASSRHTDAIYSPDSDSTLRFESKHCFLKKVLRQLMNYRNICLSLTNRHQLYLALKMSDTEYLEPASVTQHEPSLCPLSVMNSNIQNKLTSYCDSHGNVRCYKSATIHGTSYQPDMAVALGVDCGFVTFEIILMIVVSDDGECSFVCCSCKCYYSQHLHCYELERTDDVTVVKHTELLDYYPLSVYSRWQVLCDHEAFCVWTVDCVQWILVHL